MALPRQARLRRDQHCDVLVVGAGISGAIVAEQLSASGLHVIACDRRRPLQGSTAASTAMVLHEIDTPLAQLERRLGRHDAQRIWIRSWLAVQALRDRARQLGIRAHAVASDSLFLQGNLLDAGGLQREAAARTRAGFQVEYLSGPAVEQEYGIARRAALRSAGAFAADPVQLAAGFLRAATGRGTRLFAPEEVIDVQPGRGGVRALTRSGRQVLARQLVFATGYELPRQVPARGHRIVSTWAVATVPQPRAPWPQPTLVWEASSPYLYLRTTQDGRLLCGGGDEVMDDAPRRAALLDRKRRWLQARLAALRPGVDTRVDFAWGGSFGQSRHGLPTIGPIPGLRHCHAVMGFGGNGITFSMMAAQVLRNVLCGDGDPDLDLLGFGRHR